MCQDLVKSLQLETMSKFNIQVIYDHEEDGDLDYIISQAIAYEVLKQMNMPGYIKKAQEEIHVKKEQLIKDMKSELASWDKSALAYEYGKLTSSGFQVSVVKEVVPKVVALLKADKEFIGDIAAYIIKEKFKN